MIRVRLQRASVVDRTRPHRHLGGRALQAAPEPFRPAPATGAATHPQQENSARTGCRRPGA